MCNFCRIKNNRSLHTTIYKDIPYILSLHEVISTAQHCDRLQAFTCYEEASGRAEAVDVEK